MPAPLPVFKIILGAFVFLWNKKLRFLRALLIPVMVIFAIGIFPYFISFKTYLEDFSSSIFIPITIGVAIINYAAYILFAITCHRLVLMKNTSVPAYGMLCWSRREWWFLAYFILLPFVYLLSMALNLMAHGLLKEFNVQIENLQIIFLKGDGIFLLMLLAALPSVYIVSRFSLLFPATAVDRDVDVDWAWKISKKNGWQLTVIIGLLPFVFVGFRVLHILLWRENPTWIDNIISMLLGFILLAVEIIALSLSYKHLTENEIVAAKEEGTAV
jgi:hypothetical protein